MRALPLNWSWSQFILILCSILVASLIFHLNLVKTYGLKINVQRRKLMFSAFQFSITICSAFKHPVPPSPLAAPETTSFAPPTPLRATLGPFLSPRQFRRNMGNHIPLCDMYIQAPRWYISASLNSPRPSAFPHHREVERQPHDHERQTYIPTEPRAHDPSKLQDHMIDEPTESRKGIMQSQIMYSKL